MTLHRILVHMTAETNRHAGHADIVRELIDGAVGMSEGNDNKGNSWIARVNHSRGRARRRPRMATGAVFPVMRRGFQ